MQHRLERLRRKINPGRIVAFVLAALILALALFSAVLTRKIVTVEDSAGGAHVMLTSDREPERYMDLASLVAGQYDQLSFTENDETASVLIQRAFPVGVRADGWLHRAEMVEGTVAELLAACDIVLEGEDYVEPAPETPVTQDMEAVVHRVTYSEEAVPGIEVAAEEIAAYVERLRAADPEAPFEESNAGVYDVTYQHRYIDGELVGSQITSLSAIQMILPAGNRGGRPNGGWTRVMNANCTAYSSSGGRGASGLGLYYGTVAVNPNVIPYGTRMWIESADGSYVYGWAIATDTGIAMMASNNAVDLYFETYGESVQFGRRWLNVYIFD